MKCTKQKIAPDICENAHMYILSSHREPTAQWATKKGNDDIPLQRMRSVIKAEVISEGL